MVGPLLDQLGPGMLLIWDRGFFSYELIRSVCERGAHLLARLRATPYCDRSVVCGMALTWPKSIPVSPTAVGSTRGFLVRVIEYTHDDPNRPGAGERHRLITDLTNLDDLLASDAPLV